MRFLWLTILILVVLLLAAIMVYRRGLRQTPDSIAWLANTEDLRGLPSYQRQLYWNRAGAGALVALLTVFSISVAVVAGAPVERRVDHPKLASRDIVLCLDASGSMLPYDGQILRQFDQMVEKFQGERLSLHMWSAQTIVKFPLTDDYELISEVLNQAARVIDEGYFGPDGDYVLVSAELADYLSGVDAPDGVMISSLVGDGLATCVLGFDHQDSERSRTVILATDNEVMGEQIYSLSEAAQFANDQDIDIIALNPGDGGPLTAEAEQLKYVVESNGGVFYNANDPGAIAEIIQGIEAQQAIDLEGTSKVVETDTPQTAISWAAWSLVGLLLISVVRRL